MYVNHYRTLINCIAQISHVFVNLVRVIVISGVREFDCNTTVQILYKGID